MNDLRKIQERYVLKDIGRQNPNILSKNPTIERLATPKPKDKRWIPDRPSVYWLDYIIDPTPHKLTDPEALASYYNKFEPRFPRMRLLSAPRPSHDEFCNKEGSMSRPVSVNTGIPISALTYNASERIKELALPKTPKTSVSQNKFSEVDANKLPPRKNSRQSLSTARSHSPKEKFGPFDPRVDLARGDYPSRSKYAIHKRNSTERVPTTTPNSNSNSKLRARSGYQKRGSTVTRDILRNDKKRPISRTLYSVRY